MNLQNLIQKLDIKKSQRNWKDAWQIAEKIAKIIPNDPGIYSQMGLILAETGRINDAIKYTMKALSLAPQHIGIKSDLGELYRRSGNFKKSIEVLMPLTKSPNITAYIWSNLGSALALNGDFLKAEEALEQALKLAPNHWDARINLAQLYNDTGRIYEAIDILNTLIIDNPSLAKAYILLGNIYIYLENPIQAEVFFDKVIKDFDQNSFEALQGQINVLRAQNKLADAIKLSEKLHKLKPDDPTSNHIRARLLAASGEIEAADSAYRKAVKLANNYFRSIWGSSQLLPRISSSKEEMAISYQIWLDRTTQIDTELRLDNPGQISEAVYALSQENNFSLHYHPGDHLAAQKIYGRILSRIAAAAYPRFAEPKSFHQHDKPRIAFISPHLHAHSINKTHGWWIKHSNTDIEKIVYYLGHEPDSHEIHNIKISSDAFHHLTNPSALLDIISREQPNVLIWLDHGMDARWQLLAGLPLAPIQINGLGHPVTSGLASMTHAISAELMETVNYQSHYTENLILLPGTASFYEINRLEEQAKYIKRERNSQEIWALCSQNLRKYLPQDDYLFAEIAYGYKNVRFHFIANQPDKSIEVFKKRIKNIFARYKLDYEEFCRFHPQLPQIQYLQLNRECDIFLDNPGWNGNNTSHEAAFFGLPIVSLAGELMRERHSVPIVTALGTAELLACSHQDYINKAIKLCQSPNYRKELQERTHEGKKYLFDNNAPIVALYHKLTELVKSL